MVEDGLNFKFFYDTDLIPLGEDFTITIEATSLSIYETMADQETKASDSFDLIFLNPCTLVDFDAAFGVTPTYADIEYTLTGNLMSYAPIDEFVVTTTPVETLGLCWEDDKNYEA